MEDPVEEDYEDQDEEYEEYDQINSALPVSASAI